MTMTKEEFLNGLIKCQGSDGRTVVLGENLWRQETLEEGEWIPRGEWRIGADDCVECRPSGWPWWIPQKFNTDDFLQPEEWLSLEIEDGLSLDRIGQLMKPVYETYPWYKIGLLVEAGKVWISHDGNRWQATFVDDEDQLRLVLGKAGVWTSHQMPKDGDELLEILENLE